MDNLVAVLDTSALLAYITGEPRSEVVEKVIDKSMVSVINLTEAGCVIHKDRFNFLNTFNAISC